MPHTQHTIASEMTCCHFSHQRTRHPAFELKDSTEGQVQLLLTLLRVEKEKYFLGADLDFPGHPSQPNEFQASERPCFRNNIDSVAEE